MKTCGNNLYNIHAFQTGGTPHKRNTFFFFLPIPQIKLHLIHSEKNCRREKNKGSKPLNGYDYLMSGTFLIVNGNRSK